MNKYKTFEDLKKELGDKFEEYMYKSNIQLLTKIDKAIEKLKEIKTDLDFEPWSIYQVKGEILFDLLEILGDKENE